jgi:hypothetical protein
MLARLKAQMTPPMIVALLALFVALGGAGYAATGGNLILGNPNDATSPTTLDASGAATTYGLKVSNANTAAGATAARFEVPQGHPPFTVNRQTKVPALNADLLDGLSANAFLQPGKPVIKAGTTGNAIVDATNTGVGNGVSGRAGAGANAIYGDNTGAGYAGWFEDKVHIGTQLECPGCVGASDVEAGTFVRGAGTAAGQRKTLPPGLTDTLGPAMAGFLRLGYVCPSNVANPGTLQISNDSGAPARLVIERTGLNPIEVTVNPSDTLLHAGTSSNVALAPLTVWNIHADGAPGMMRIDVSASHRTANCHVKAQGLLTS